MHHDLVFGRLDFKPPRPMVHHATLSSGGLDRCKTQGTHLLLQHWVLGCSLFSAGGIPELSPIYCENNKNNRWWFALASHTEYYY